MSFDSRYLTLAESGRYLGRSVRWMRRHWTDLVRDGCEAYRVPKDAPKGHLLFLKSGLDNYITKCQIQPAKMERELS